MSGTFVRSRLDDLPPYLAGPEGEALATGLGEAQDGELPLLRAAAVSDLPDLCPDDALEGPHTVGDWFSIDRYAADTTDTYRTRVSAAFPTWAQAGSAVAIEQQIQAFGIPDVRCYADDEGTFGPGPSGSWYSRFWVFLGPDYGSTGIAPMILGSWTLGTGTLGSTATRDQIIAIKRIILKWKAAHGFPVRVILLFGSGPILGVGVAGGAKPLTLGAFTLGGASTISWPIGRTLNDTITTLGFTLGGYEV